MGAICCFEMTAIFPLLPTTTTTTTVATITLFRWGQFFLFFFSSTMNDLNSSVFIPTHFLLLLQKKFIKISKYKCQMLLPHGIYTHTHKKNDHHHDHKKKKHAWMCWRWASLKWDFSFLFFSIWQINKLFFDDKLLLTMMMTSWKNLNQENNKKKISRMNDDCLVLKHESTRTIFPFNIRFIIACVFQQQKKWWLCITLVFCFFVVCVFNLLILDHSVWLQFNSGFDKSKL